MNPSRTIDELARLALRAAGGWPDDCLPLPAHEGTPTPHLDALERAADAALPPLPGYTCNGGDGSSVRTCTLPNGMAKPSGGSRNGAGGNGTKEGSSSDGVWTWNPQVNNAHNTYTKDEDDGQCSTPSLEDMALFSPEFYRAIGELAREAYHPGSTRRADVDAKIAASDAAARDGDGASLQHVRHEASTIYGALDSLERYSVPRMNDAARITRILLAMQEMNVGDDGSFVQQLLRCCEGASITADSGPSHERDIMDVDSESHVDGSGSTNGKRIPILSALFHHWGHLPQMEHGLQQLARKFGALLPSNAAGYREYCDYSSFESSVGSVGDGGSTGGEWRPPTSSALSSPSHTSFLGERAMRIDALRSRLEEELRCHIHGSDDEKIGLGQSSHDRGGLVELLALCYRHSDAAARGKCRRWMGRWLRSLALGGGSMASYATEAAAGDLGLGPSLASFCPLLVSMSLANANAPVGGAKMATMAVTGPISITHVGGGGGMPHHPLGMENTSACGVEALLTVLRRIIMGFRPLPTAAGKAKDTGRRSGVLRPSHEHLLFDVLIPLHRPSGMVLWRDQTPLIGLYHESLVKAIGAFLDLDGSLVGPVVGALLHPEIWPDAEGGNTPKVVLLLHEVDTLIGLLLSNGGTDIEEEDRLASFHPYLFPLASRLCACISSENSRTSERALQFFRNKTFQRLVQTHLDDVGPMFLRALCRCPSREVPWNPTVRKMTLLVLRELEGYYKETSAGDESFGRACEEAFSGVDLSVDRRVAMEVTKSSKGTVKMEKHLGDGPVMSVNMTSLRGAMGSWKPPPQKAGSTRVMASRQPPSTVTGVAPWAMGGQSGASRPKASGPKQPPVTVTGVAPWAVKTQPHGLPPSSSSRKAPTPNAIPRPSKKHVPGQSLPSTPSGIVSGNAEIGGSSGSNGHTHGIVESQRTALEEVRSYMEKLKPKVDDAKGDDGISSWAKAQMEESPVLFPNMKFHDLVFGQELGTGAFSTVKYCRRIVKTSSRSKWPEYAVKIVSTQKIEELGYEQSIQREIAILRTLSHPGISRLISSFRFRDGAYLILEYASGGDLHTLLRKNGSLDHDSTRFVIGSVAAALWSIHERGFVYADCKPENILITETGHIKVTDFGGCRPVTQEAKTLVNESSKNLLRELRDGDWKPHAEASSMDTGEGAPEKNLDDEEDLRIEGTTAYLPPEVVIGGYPTTAADIWALGCVLFQCLSGRPPILEDTDDLTAQRIVTFDLNTDKHSFFGDCGETTFRDDAKALIERMLNRDAARRPDIPQMADDAFFSGVDIFSLHERPAYPLDVGSIAPASDAKWSRRQFSSIWAPQPQAYNIGASSNNSSQAGKARNESAIREGNEVDEEFLPRQKAPMLSKIRE